MRFHSFGLLGMVAASCLTSGALHAETLGYVVTTWNFAGEYTQGGKTECPNGFNPDNRDNFRAQFKTEAEREEQMRKYSNFEMRFRGPNGEVDLYNPEIVKDPLGYTDAQGKISTGVNLDGTADGRATDKTCTHTKLTSPDGRKDVDNQMYRVTACNRATRPDGLFDSFFNNEIITKLTNRYVVEISGVDNRENDDHVDVMLAHGLDKLVQDSNGGFVPGLSQRVDADMPRYTARTTGRIEKGVLITAPFTKVQLPTTSFLEDGEHHFKNAALRLELKANSATGVLAGYHDVDRYYRFWAKTTGLHGVSNTVSPPSFWAALKRNADGFKDPTTGQCTAISAAYDIKLVSAFIVHPPQNVALTQ